MKTRQKQRAENCCQRNSDLMQNSWPTLHHRPQHTQSAHLSGGIFLIFQCPGRIFRCRTGAVPPFILDLSQLIFCVMAGSSFLCISTELLLLIFRRQLRSSGICIEGAKSKLWPALLIVPLPFSLAKRVRLMLHLKCIPSPGWSDPTACLNAFHFFGGGRHFIFRAKRVVCRRRCRIINGQFASWSVQKPARM